MINFSKITPNQSVSPMPLTVSISVSIFLAFVAVFSFSCPVFAQDTQNTPTFVFLRDLRIGDTGEDVLALQKLLNSDQFTQVSTVGNGSLGLETTTFGPATQSAVMRFQQKYANEVLRPAGVAVPSGFVGLWTRLKLNQILLNGVVAVTPPNTPAVSPLETEPAPSFVAELSGFSTNLSLGSRDSSQSSDSGNSDKLSIFYSSKYYGSAGKNVTLTGSGFSKTSNTVKLDGSLGESRKKYEIKDIPSINGSVLTFQVPLEVLPGRYDIKVSVGNKTSDPIPYMVTASGAIIPKILQIEPAVVKFGQQIKVTGENFTPKGNIVSSSFGVVKDLSSSDGSSLFFSIPRPAGLKSVSDSPRVLADGINERDARFWPTTIYVYNTNGISKNTSASQFLLDIR